MHPGLLLAIALVLVLVGQALPPANPARQPYTTWNDYAGAPDSSQYSALKQIHKTNVSRLEQAWFYAVPDRKVNFGFNPLIVDGAMYVAGQGNTIVALDAATGKQIWSHTVEDGEPAYRGINYWESKDRSDRRLIFGAGNWLHAINARTGITINTFGDDGRVNMRVGTPRALGGPSSSPGRIFENLLIVGREFVVFCASGTAVSVTPVSSSESTPGANISFVPGKLTAQGYYVFALPLTAKGTKK